MMPFKLMVTLCLAVIAMVVAPGFVTEAHAYWGGLYCDLYGDSTDALEQAIEFYNQDDPADRGCTTAVRFFEPVTLSIPDGLTITQLPFSGHAYGVAVRKCIATGTYAEEGCPVMSDTDVVLDASSYSHDDGDCPIKVAAKAMVDFLNFKLIVKNKDKAICDFQGRPIPLEDQSNQQAWIHGVTIVEPQVYVSRGSLDFGWFQFGKPPVKNRRF